MEQTATFEPEVRRPAGLLLYLQFNIIRTDQRMKYMCMCLRIDLKPNKKKRKGGKKWKFKSRESASTLGNKGSHRWLIRTFWVNNRRVQRWKKQPAWKDKSFPMKSIFPSMHCTGLVLLHEKADVAHFPLQNVVSQSDQFIFNMTGVSLHSHLKRNYM